MYDSFLQKCQKAFTNLSYYINALFFRHELIFLDDFGEITIAKLLYYIVVIRAFHKVLKLDDVVGVDRL